MITSLIMKDRYNVAMDGNGKFTVHDQKLSIREVPAVRYRFDGYTFEDSMEYIKYMIEKFSYSVHIMEVDLENDKTTKEDYDKILDSVDTLANFLYLDVTDAEVENGCIREELVNKIMNEFNRYDRIMLRDKSTNLHTVSANAIIKDLAKKLNIDDDFIGICGSPLSFGDRACLTAVRARTLAADFAQSMDCVVPSANHQCMTSCGCIRHIEVDGDTEMPKSKAGKASGKVVGHKKSNGGNEESGESGKTKKKPKGKVMPSW